MSTELESIKNSELIEQVVTYLESSDLRSREWRVNVRQVTLTPNPDGIESDSDVWDNIIMVIKRHYSRLYYEQDNIVDNIRYRHSTGDIESESAKLQKYRDDYRKVTDIDFYNLFESIGGELVNKSGKIVKRLMREFKRVAGMELPNDIVSKLGNLITESVTVEPDSVVVDITNQFTWNDGEFGHSGSCWFDYDQYPAALDSLESIGGYAMRKFEVSRYGGDLTDSGRLWFIPVRYEGTESFVAFNSYGYKGDMSKASKILAKLIQDATGVEYKTTPVYFENSGSGSTMYINPDQRLIHPVTVKVPRLSDLTVYIPRVEGDNYARICDESEGEGYYCESCEDRFSEDDIIYQDGYYYCESCFDDIYTRCYHCGDATHNDDIVTSDSGIAYCESCYNDKFSRCESCDSEVSTGDIVEFDNSYYCEDCANDRSRECEDCNDRVDINECHITESGDSYCESCWSEHVFTCKSCGQELEVSQLAHDESCVTWNYYASKFEYDSKRDDSNPLRLCVTCFDNRPVITSGQLPLFELA